MANPEKPKQGCFSGFIRVLLCAGNGTSPPVHPSDHVTEQDETELVHSKTDAVFEDTATTPGLVARLMGLESLPKTNFLMKGATPDSVTRSRSVNFVDYMVNFDVVGKASHRRLKTSASFREVPVPVPALARRVQDDNNDLVVFCWDGDVCKEHEVGFELRKMGIGFEELKQGKKQGKKQGNKNNKEIIVRERVISVKKERENNNQGKNKKISKLKNEPRRAPSTNYGKKVRNQSEDRGFSSVSSSSKSSSSCSSSKLQNNKQKKESVESCHKKRIRKEKLSKKMESDCNSENISQVSVLDIGTNCLDGISPLASKSKWKSTLKSLSDGAEHSSSNNKGFACVYTDINKEAEYYSELLLNLQTLTQQDIREFDCTTRRIYEYEEFEKICFSFEHKILDRLLHEVVNELL